MVVPVRRLHLGEGRAAVAGAPEPQIAGPDGVRVERIGEDVAVVPGSAGLPGVLVHPGPGVAAVVAAVDPALLVGGFHHRVHAVRRGRGDRHPDAPFEQGGESRRGAHRLPAQAAVQRAVQIAVVAAADHLPRPTDRLPDGCEGDLGIRRVQRQVGRAGPVADEQHVLPAAAAVGAAEDTALRTRTEDVAQRGHPHGVRIVVGDPHPGDVPGVVEAAVGPAGPAVGAPVDAVAGDHVVPGAGLAGADPYRVGSAVCDRDGTDR